MVDKCHSPYGLGLLRVSLPSGLMKQVHIGYAVLCGTKFERNRDRKTIFGPSNLASFPSYLWSDLRITLTLFDVIITTLQVKKMQPKGIRQHAQVYVVTQYRHSQSQGPQMPILVLVQLKESAVFLPQLWNFSTCGWCESMKNPSAIIRNLWIHWCTKYARGFKISFAYIQYYFSNVYRWP